MVVGEMTDTLKYYQIGDRLTGECTDSDKQKHSLWPTLEQQR
jgi:hypothetical protein